MKLKLFACTIVFFSLLIIGCKTIQPALDLDENTWQINDIKIHHFEKGKGEIILILHGGPGIPYSHPIPGLDQLTDKYRFVYFDQRGCGKSTHPFEKFENGKTGKHIWELISTLGYKQHINDIESIRMNLNTDQIILMGHSFGSILACLYAQKYPDRVKAMILVAPAGMITSEPDVDIFTLMEQKLTESELLRFQTFKDQYFDFKGTLSKSEDELRRLNLQFGKYWLMAMSPDKTDWFSILPNDTSTAGGFMPYGIYFSFGKEWDFTDNLKKIKAPVLIIHGQNDLQPLAVSNIYLENLPNATLKVIQDASHFPFVETPDEFNHLLQQFLDKILTNEISS